MQPNLTRRLGNTTLEENEEDDGEMDGEMMGEDLGKFRSLLSRFG